MKPRASIFLDAAKRLNRYRYGHHTWGSQFCCDNIENAAADVRGQYMDNIPELDMFIDLFRPNHLPSAYPWSWWDRADDGVESGGHDYESRLIALLLCWAMLKDGYQC